MALFDRLFGSRRMERIRRQLVRDRERLAQLSAGGSAEHPIEVAAASVVEVRARAMSCPHCGATYRMHDHRAVGPGLRAVDVRCQLCSTRRTLWFRLGSAESN